MAALLVLCGTLSAQEHDFLENDVEIGDIEPSWIVHDGTLYFLDYREGATIEVPRSAITLTEHGYIAAETHLGTMVLIPGTGRFETFFPEHRTGERLESRRAWLIDEVFPYEWPPDIGIESITASSFFQEYVGGELVQYVPENLLHRFYSERESPFMFNECALPWAEGQPDSGVGATLTIQFNGRKNLLTILNGYVDYDRMHLYRDNGRVRSMRVASDEGDFSFVYEFEDYVHFADITLPGRVSGVTLEILDVYEGRRYSDTCISAIFSNP